MVGVLDGVGVYKRDGKVGIIFLVFGIWRFFNYDDGVIKVLVFDKIFFSFFGVYYFGGGRDSLLNFL